MIWKILKNIFIKIISDKQLIWLQNRLILKPGRFWERVIKLVLPKLATNSREFQIFFLLEHGVKNYEK